MSAPDVPDSRLVDAAIRLVEDRPDLPAGAVLRCFARAVLMTRHAEVAPDGLAAQADLLARRILAF